MGKKFVAGFLVAILFITTSGCAHPLNITNLQMYKAGFINSSHIEGTTIGIIKDYNQPDTDRLVDATANNLKKNGFNVIYPYYASSKKEKVDYIVKLNTLSEYKGKGSNFFVNFPGFLIFAPALFGYGYEANYTFDIDITETATQETLPRISVPIRLNIRHAATNRTWTEISWFEVGIIALIGGICFMSYDPQVTSLVLDRYENKLGDYIASKISSALIGKILS